MAAVEANERVAGIASRRVEVAQTLGEFLTERLAQTAEDARERTGAERERVEVAAEDARQRMDGDRERVEVAAHEARERVAEILGLGRIWRDHVTVMGSAGGRGFRHWAPPSLGYAEAQGCGGKPRPQAAREPAGAQARGGQAAARKPAARKPRRPPPGQARKANARSRRLPRRGTRSRRWLPPFLAIWPIVPTERSWRSCRPA